ncbi:MAG: HyaD/HybD family hydrogenase maturation endopeptidase, partial [Hydrogenophaga sp.]|nr:HyaD/HybD family hydrogenase maturation endopeptidase [Hydrogenophaga sp.]
MSAHPSESTCHPCGDTPARPQTIVVLGIGNLLWADEGFGVRCIEALQRRFEFADHVSLIDGGTQGLYLIQHVQAADALLIFDAIDYGLEPGTLKEVRDDAVPRFMGAKKMSLHQTGFQEVLSLAQLTGKYP